MRVYVLVLSLSLLAAPVHAKCPADATTASFLAPGRFGVAMRDLTLVTTVWYPTAPGAANGALAPGGPFPLVVSSHGFSDLRLGAIYLATALASRGYVVAAPDFPLTRFGTQPAPVLPDVRNQPADVSFVIDQLLERSRTRGEWLAGGVDRHRIGVSGLSLGGLTTLLLAYHPQLRDPRVRAAVALAPAACYLAADFYRTARPPLLLVNGDQDAITPLDTNATRVFGLSRSPRQLLTLAGATHTAFSGLITGPPTANYDTAIGCPVVEQLTQADVDAAVDAIGAAGANLVDSTGCALPCTGPAPTGATMAATRQHDLTRAAVTAFFESTLRRSRAARCFLGRGLAAENADVASALAPRRRLKGP